MASKCVGTREVFVAWSNSEGSKQKDSSKTLPKPRPEQQGKAEKSIDEKKIKKESVRK